MGFDMQKNQPLPKLFIGEVWLYNLTVVCQTDDNTQSKVDVSEVGDVEVKTVYSQEETFTSFFKKRKKLAELDAAVKIPQTNKVQVPHKKDAEENTREVFQCLLALRFLPVTDIDLAFKDVTVMVTEDSPSKTQLEQLCCYVHKQWLTRKRHRAVTVVGTRQHFIH